MERDEVIGRLRAQLHVGRHILGAAVGSGMTAKLAALGGADLLLALAAGKFRIMGRSSLASYFCYANNNEQVMEMGVRVYMDISMKRFATIFPACGSSNSAIELTPDELEKYSAAVGWVDVCK